eukprot:1740024-Amphidinium_carterae.1
MQTTGLAADDGSVRKSDESMPGRSGGRPCGESLLSAAAAYLHRRCQHGCAISLLDILCWSCFVCAAAASAGGEAKPLD